MTNQTDLQFIHYFYDCWKKSWHLFHMHASLEQVKPQAQGQSSHPPASPVLRMCLRILLFEYRRVYGGVFSLKHIMGDQVGNSVASFTDRLLDINSFTPVKKHPADLPKHFIQATPPLSLSAPPLYRVHQTHSPPQDCALVHLTVGGVFSASWE